MLGSIREHRHEIGLMRRNNGDARASDANKCGDAEFFSQRRHVMHAKLSRRQTMSMIAGATVCAAGSTRVSAADRSLGSIASENGFVFGAAAGPVIDKDAAYRQLYVDH